jgi:glycosyltransferase involved in cell wall biosynthesis
MKILALTNLYPNPWQPHRAPFNRHHFRMLSNLHAVRVIAPVAWTDEWAARRGGQPPLPASRRIVHDGLTVDHPRYWYTPKLLRSCYGRFFLESVRSTFRRVLGEFRPDVVFAPWAYPDGYAAVQLGREAGLPVVVQVHGSDIRQLGRYPSREAGTSSAVREARGVIAVCQELADGVIGLGAEASRVRVIIDGVDRELFAPGCKRTAREQLGWRGDLRHLLFVGNLVPVKGLDVLFAACRRLTSGIGPWQLHVVGGGPLKPALIRQARQLGLQTQIVFHGQVPHDELPAWFRAADLFVLASRSEGVPNVLQEAMACGLPFVASRVGGIPEIAHLGTCRLVTPERPVEFAAAMEDVLASPVQPLPGPRDRREAVAEIAQFLETCAC